MAFLAEMNTRSITLGTGSDGSATQVTNPEGESSLRVMQVSPNGAITTTRHDEILRIRIQVVSMRMD